MKVDLGQCAVCGAKNSKYVEKCYKCGATLPWASGYVAPKNAPQKPTPQTAATSADTGAKTVVIPPIDDHPEPAPTIEPEAAPDARGIKQRAQSKVPVPAWALIVGGLGLLVLGMALWALLGRKPMPTTVAVAPTPAALAPIAPTETVQPTFMPAAEATVSPTVEPTMSATVAPTTEAGPAFDEIYANLTTGTAQQQELYWNSIKGKKISWRGEFVSLGSAASGPLVVNCRSGTSALKVNVVLDAATPQILPKYIVNQSVPFAGILESYSAGEVTVKDGRVG